MLLHWTGEDGSAEWASPSLADLESGVSQPSFWLLFSISTAPDKVLHAVLCGNEAALEPRNHRQMHAVAFGD